MGLVISPYLPFGLNGIHHLLLMLIEMYYFFKGNVPSQILYASFFFLDTKVMGRKYFPFLDSDKKEKTRTPIYYKLVYVDRWVTIRIGYSQNYRSSFVLTDGP